MKKKLLILLVMLLAASLTLAAGGGVRITGTITAIDEDAKTITVNTLTFQITDDTDITLADGTCGTLEFTDLEVGQYVRVVGVYHADTIIAKKIVVH